MAWEIKLCTKIVLKVKAMTSIISIRWQQYTMAKQQYPHEHKNIGTKI